MAEAELGILLEAKDHATGTINSLKSHLGGIGTTASHSQGLLGGLTDGLGKLGLAGLGVGVIKDAFTGLTGAIGSVIGPAADFEARMSAIKAVSGATGAEIKQISALALQLGKDTAFSASEAAKGIEELIKGGVDIADIMGGAAKAALDLAAAGEIELADAAEIAANAMSMFGLEGKDMAHVADQIAGAANASSLSVGDFKYSMAAAGSIAALTGQSFDDLAQAIAVMGASGIKGSDAGTSLKTMLMNLQPQTKKQTEEFTRLGLVTLNSAAVMKEATLRGLDLSGSLEDVSQRLYSSITGWQEGEKVTDKMGKAWQEATQELGLMSNKFIDANGQFLSMSEISGVLQNALVELTDAQKTAALEVMFGSDAIRAAAILADAGAEGFNDMAAAMGKVTAASVGAEKLNNYTGAMEQLQGSIETLKIIIGTALLPVLRQGTDALTGLVNAAMPIAEQMAPAVGTALTDLRNIAQQALNTLGVDFTGTFQAIPEIINAGMEAARAYIDNATANIRAIVSVALAELNRLWAAHGDDITTKARLIWDSIQQTIDDVLAYIVPWIQEQFGVVIAWTQENWPLIKDTIEQIMKAIIFSIEVTLAGIIEFWNRNGEEIMAVTGVVWNIVKTTVETVMAGVLDTIKLIMQLITGDWEGAWNTILGMADRAMKLIMEMAENLKNVAVGAFVSMVDQMVDAVLSLPGRLLAVLPALMEAVGKIGSALNPLNAAAGVIDAIVPGFAGGVTNFGGGLAIVGERGPELVALPRGANVYPANETQQMLQGGGETHYHYSPTFIVPQAPNTEQEFDLMKSWVA